MKSLKILGLATVAAAALIAFVGAGSASATVLCKNNSSTSACSETYGSGQVLEASLSGTTTLETTGGTTLDTCTGGTLKSKTTNAGGTSETVKANVETLSWSGCTKTTDTVKNGSLEIHWISGTDNGTLTGKESEWTINTLFGTCTYGFGTGTDLGTITGGNPAKLSVAAILAKTAGNVTCPAEARWTAEYSFTEPKPLYVVSAGGGGATETSLTTSLSGEEKSGEEITVNEGSKVKDTATLSGTNASKATGTVKYKVYADKECKELVTSAGEVTVSEGKVPASEEEELEAGRVYYWQAEYSGDTNNLKSTSTCGKEVLTVKAATSVSTLLTAGEESGEVLEVEEEVAVTDTATLSGTKSSTATGKVKYRVYADLECEELVTEAGEVTVSEGKAPTSEAITLEPGIYFWQAEYAGDITHNPSTSGCGEVIQQVAPPTVTLHEKTFAGAALLPNAGVQGASGNLVFETAGKDLIECKENNFAGKVLRNGQATADIELTSWEFKKGGAEGERCQTTIKVGGKPVDAVITPLVMGTLKLWVDNIGGGGAIRPFEIKLELFVEEVRELTCRFGSVAIPTSFTFKANLGLTLAAINNQRLVVKPGSQENCGPTLSLSGGITVTTKGGDPVVPTTP